ncbi:unnamed protein product [Rhodiola kirilowii]
MAQNQVPVADAVANGDSTGPIAAPSHPKTVALYVGDLDVNVTDTQLFDYFNGDGQVVNVRVCRDLTSKRSLGYGYVNFPNHESAARAMQALNYTLLNGKPIRIMHSNRDPTLRKSGAGNIFIKNLEKSIDTKSLLDTFSHFGNVLSCKVAMDYFGQSKGFGFVQFEQEDSAQRAIKELDESVSFGYRRLFEEIFGEYGPTTSRAVMTDGEGKSKCFGFVNFENAEDAAKAVEGLNGKTFDDKEWTELVDRTYGLNLYIKNLDDGIDDEKLKDMFTEFGTIKSHKVMRDPNGLSRGTAFVAFSHADEASKALAVMNGKMVGSKPLYVSYAQRKEDRRARLQAQFSQMRSGPITPPFSPRIPAFPPGMAQPIYFGQAPPAMVPPQCLKDSKGSDLVEGVGGQQQSQPHLPMMAPQMFPMGRMVRFPPMRGMHEAQLHGVPGNMLAGPYEMNGTASRESAGQQAQPLPSSILITALANAAPDQQKLMLGENLYPLVRELEPEAAGKVTGMLLEMDQGEVLHLIDSPEALKSKVDEAMDVLRKSTVQQSNTPDEQLSALSLKDNHA